MFDKYKDEYRKTRASRYLVLVPSQGSVKLELERESGTLTIQTSPEAASVIGLFETKGKCRHYGITKKK
jgi:hypothetical protein